MSEVRENRSTFDHGLTCPRWVIGRHGDAVACRLLIKPALVKCDRAPTTANGSV